MARNDYLRELDSIRVDYPLDNHPATGRENTHGPEITAGDLVGGQFNNGLNQKLENLRTEAKGNYSAAQRLVGLEGASVFDDLDNDEIGHTNPLAARAKEKADNQYAAARAITLHVEANPPPAELVNIAAELQNRHGYQFRLEPLAHQWGTKSWAAVGERENGEVLSDELAFEYWHDPQLGELLSMRSAQLDQTATDPNQMELNPSSVNITDREVTADEWQVALETAHIAITREPDRIARVEEAEPIAAQKVYERVHGPQTPPQPKQNIDFGPEVN